MKNRISSHPDPAFQKKYLTLLDTLLEMSAELIVGTNADDMKNGLDMGTRDRLTFAKDAFAMASENPKLIEDEDSSLKDFETDMVRILFLLLVQDKRATLRKILNQAMILTGKDLMEQAAWVLAELYKRKDNPKYAEWYVRLNRLYENRQKRAQFTKKMKATQK
jgi:hypothetical protein